VAGPTKKMVYFFYSLTASLLLSWQLFSATEKIDSASSSPCVSALVQLGGEGKASKLAESEAARILKILNDTRNSDLIATPESRLYVQLLSNYLNGNKEWTDVEITSGPELTETFRALNSLVDVGLEAVDKNLGQLEGILQDPRNKDDLDLRETIDKHRRLKRNLSNYHERFQELISLSKPVTPRELGVMAHQLSMISQFGREGFIQKGSKALFNFDHYIDENGSLTKTTIADDNPGLLLVPVTGHFGFHRFNSNIFLPVHFVGVSRGIEKVDATSFDETSFARHDINHIRQIEDRRMNPSFSKETKSRVAKIIHSTADQLEKRIEAQRYYLKVREKLASTPRQRVLWEALWFYSFHEVGLKMDLQYIKEVYAGKVKLTGFLADRDLKADFASRIQNHADLGLAFKTPPTINEIDKTFSMFFDR